VEDHELPQLRIATNPRLCGAIVRGSTCLSGK
jgi:hypothetical protein